MGRLESKDQKTLKRLPGSPGSPRSVSTAVLLCTGRQVSRSYMVFSDFQKEFNSLACQLAPVRPHKGKTQMQFVFFDSDGTDSIVSP